MEQLEETMSDYKKLISGLEGRRDALEALSKHWEEFETRLNGAESQLSAIEEKNKLVDTTVRSKQHLLDSLEVLEVRFLKIKFNIKKIQIYIHWWK